MSKEIQSVGKVLAITEDFHVLFMNLRSSQKKKLLSGASSSMYSPPGKFSTSTKLPSIKISRLFHGGSNSGKKSFLTTEMRQIESQESMTLRTCLDYRFPPFARHDASQNGGFPVPNDPGRIYRSPRRFSSTCEHAPNAILLTYRKSSNHRNGHIPT